MGRTGSSYKAAKKSNTKHDFPKETESDEASEMSSITSSTIEMKKKINKPTLAPIRNPKLLRSKRKKQQTSASQSSRRASEVNLCKLHHAKIEFICKEPNCLQELCGHCILTHKEHINKINSISNLLKEFIESEHAVGSPSNSNNSKRMCEEISTYYNQNLKMTETLAKELKTVVDTQTAGLQKKLSDIFQESTAMVENLGILRKQAPAILNEGNFTQDQIELIKSNLKLQNCNQNKISLTPPLTFSIDTIVTDLKNSLNDNIIFHNKTSELETTYAGVPKILHWFEWGKKKLNIYDIVTNTTSSVELDITFKIPSFSRSIILPNGHVYLLGGEEPEYYSRREIFMYDSTANDGKLHPRASMPFRKFDFTLCHLNGHIYVICGKDSASEVVNTCERYSVQDNQWTSIAAVNKKRYAASAVGFTNNRVYLFGGRSDYSNTMIQEIEEFKVELNEWSILTLKNASGWVPVEVCACIQISDEEILIFGGSDARIKDSQNSVVFKVTDNSFEKRSELKRPQVFVNTPFLYKNHVYALGNEYYMKQRNLHRYSIEKQEWSIIF